MDGAMAVVTLAIMFAYSIKLALIVFCVFLLYCAVRLAFFRVLRNLNETAIQMKATETSSFVESLRATQSKALQSRERAREPMAKSLC